MASQESANCATPERTAPVSGTQGEQQGPPYERALIRAFDKLTSEIFIFLLAYLILVIGLSVFGPALSAQLRSLFYILPVLGIVAYVWLQSRKFAKDARAHGIRLVSLIAKSGAVVGGVRGRGVGAADNVEVTSVFASGDGTSVVGHQVPEENPQSSSAEEEYLLQMFRKLDERKRRKLLNEVSRLLDTHS
jgi:hypothetical protein